MISAFIRMARSRPVDLTERSTVREVVEISQHMLTDMCDLVWDKESKTRLKSELRDLARCESEADDDLCF